MSDDWTIDTLREHLTVLREADQHALALQATEYERRLDALNGEARRIQAVQSESVTAEKFADYQRSEEARRVAREATVDAAIDDLRGLLVVLTGEVREDRARDTARRRQNTVLIAGVVSAATLAIGALALLL